MTLSPVIQRFYIAIQLRNPLTNYPVDYKQEKLCWTVIYPEESVVVGFFKRNLMSGSLSETYKCSLKFAASFAYAIV